MTVFKYVTADRIDVIQNLTIRYTPPILLNDPYESNPNLGDLLNIDDLRESCGGDFYEYARAELQKEAKKRGFENMEQRIDFALRAMGPTLIRNLAFKLPEYNQAITLQLRKTLFSELGILSLSRRKDNLLLWAHYTDRHTGFVIALNEKHATFNCKRSENDELRHLHPVTYSNKRPRFQANNMEVEYLLFHKSTDWAYEEELRIVKFLSDAQAIIDTGDEKIHLFNLPPDAIEGIIIGAQMSHHHQELLIAVIQDNPELAHVSIQTARLQPDVYSLRFENLPKT